MPFKSKSQVRAMEAKAGRGEISQSTIKEFERATNFKTLPEKVTKRKQSGNNKKP